MQRKLFFSFAAVLVFSIVLFGCNFFDDMQLPESVSLKTNTELNVPLGTASYDVSSIIGKDTLKKSMQNSFGGAAQVYDFIPDSSDDTLSYLVHYPVYSVPIDIGTYLGNLNLADALGNDSSGFAFDQKITLPTIDINKTQSIIVPDVSSQIFDSMNSTLASGDTTFPSIPEPGSSSVSAATYLLDSDGNAHNSINIHGKFAKTIKYTDASAVIITLVRNDATALSSGYTFVLTATLTDSSDNPFSPSITSSATVTNGGTLKLVFGGRDLPKELRVKLDGTLSGGTSSVTHSYTINMSLSSDTKVDKISGIDATASDFGITIPSINQSVSIADMVGYFENATIGTGSVSLQAAQPVGWTGVTCGGTITMSGAGSVSTVIPDVTPTSNFVDKKLDLAGKALAPTSSDSDIKVTGDFTLTLANASIQFVNGSSAQEIKINVVCSVTKLSTATIDLNNEKYSAVPKTFSLPTDGSSGSVYVPAEMIQYVKSIDFCSETGHYKHDKTGAATATVGDGFAVACNVVNSFPAGNEFNLTLHSTFFNNYSKTPKLAGKGSTDATAELWNYYFVLDLSSYDSSTPHYIDFTFAFIDTTKVLTNLSLGATYEFGISDIKMVYDWDSLVLNTTSNEVDGTKDLSSLNLNQMMTSMPLSKADIRKIQIESLPVYFYAQKPASGTAIANKIGTLSLKGSVDLSYSYYDTSTSSYLPKTDNVLAAGSTVPFVDAVPWPTDTDAAVTSKSTVYPYLSEAKASFTDKNSEESIATIMNKYPGMKNDDADADIPGLSLNYKLHLDGGGSDVTIYSAMVDEVKSGTAADKVVNIDIDMAAILKFSFKLTDQIKIGLM